MKLHVGQSIKKDKMDKKLDLLVIAPSAKKLYQKLGKDFQL